MDYTYDLISGNVRQVDYQKDQPDALHHRYTYDADNRITEVETSADAQNWHHDARYFYYPNGPLQRVELGEHLVQGTDYAYTLQGWLKGINSDRLNPTTDMGRDGDATVVGNPNLLTGRDAYALSLGYYGDNDYKAITPSWSTVTTRAFAPVGASGTMNTEHTPLYNGNIAHTVNTLQHFGLWDATNGDQGQVLAMVYRYDQLNRLRTARGLVGLGNTNTWNGVNDAATNRYRSEYTYDANGNIETAQRWNATGAARYDSLHYHYHDAGGRRLRNRLYHLQDLAADGVVTAPDPDDLKKTTLAFDTNLGTLNTNASTNNYRYDALGNLVYDNREGITNINWTVAGKVRSVAKATGPSLAFAYGASGQRTQKQVGDPALDPNAYREHYIRDAQGNIMATYRYTNNTAASLKLSERPLYGSSRLGSLRKEVELHTLASFDPASANPVQQVDLNYELTDHLGNVCAVVTGRLLDGNGGGTAKQAELVSAQGYEAFGSLMPGRNYSAESTRYGFNGKENDNDMFGNQGTFQDYGFRMYDTRLARFISPDPISHKFPWYSPFQFAGLKPIWAVDLDGLEEFFKTDYRDINGNLYKTVIQMVSNDGASEGKQTVHHTVVQENSDQTFTKTYAGSFQGTSSGINAFAVGGQNTALTNLQRQQVLHLDAQNNPERYQLSQPRAVQLTVATVQNGVLVRQTVNAMATSMILVAGSGSLKEVGFRAIFLDAQGNELGWDTSREIYGPIYSIFNASDDPISYSGIVPTMDSLLGRGINAVPPDAFQRGGTQTFPDGTVRPAPIGTNLIEAQGNSGGIEP